MIRLTKNAIYQMRGGEIIGPLTETQFGWQFDNIKELSWYPDGTIRKDGVPHPRDLVKKVKVLEGDMT